MNRHRPGPDEPLQFDMRRAVRHGLRALGLRCPNCGGGGLFSRWVVMRDTCPQCHLFMDRREPDYFVGGYAVNFVAAELMIAGGALAAILLTWPTVPWDAIKWWLIGLMIPFPVLTYPWSKTLWLAIDLQFRPATLADFEGHGENLSGDAPEGETRGGGTHEGAPVG